MTYQEALEFIHGTYKFGSKLGLENIKELLKRLGSPEKELKFVHVAGTNGKGSTSAFIHSVLVEAGYKTGLYTSPFIETFNERIRVNHTLITEEELADHTKCVKTAIDSMIEDGFNHPTEFEVVTAIAMLYYHKHACDIVVLEVGLGGRLDATNAIQTPLVSVITPIDFDHTEYLGNTLQAIATEKAGIIKENGITVAYPQEIAAMEVVKEKCVEMYNTLIVMDIKAVNVKKIEFGSLQFDYKGKSYKSALFAPYQSENAALAIEVLDVLRETHGFKISDQDIAMGLSKAVWIGRLEIVKDNPFLIIDGAHNLHGIKGLAKSIDILGNDYHIIGIVGVLKDKDVDGMLGIIAPYLDAVVITRPDNPRALRSDELADHFVDTSILFKSDTIEEAMAFVFDHNTKTTDKTLYLAFGSLYMIGEVRRFAKNHK